MRLDSRADPQAVAQYAEGPVRFVPGHAELQRMTAILPGERAPADATVPGAGGGGVGLCVSAAAPKREGAR